MIPTFNRRRVLERTLPSLFDQDFPLERYEIIVAVDGSTDGTAEMLRGWNAPCSLRVIETPRRGPSAARNAAIRAATGELILLMDDDFICTPGLLRRHSASHDRPGPSLVHGPVLVAPDSARTMARSIVEQFYEEYHRSLDPEMELRFPAKPSTFMILTFISNSSVPRQALLDAGGFDEKIFTSEDLELGLRLWKMGVRFRFQPEAIVRELYVKSSRQFVKGPPQPMALGDLYTVHKHPECRANSDLARMAETRWWRRWLRKAMVCSPVSPLPLIMFPFRLEKPFYRFSSVRRAGVRLMLYAKVIQFQRSALQVTGSWKALQSEFARKLPVFLYHHVGPPRPGVLPGWSVSPEEFESHVRWISRLGFVGVRPSDWLRWLQEGAALPEKPVLFTFNGGYTDVAEYALPVLRRHGFSAGVYIAAGQLEGASGRDNEKTTGGPRLMTAEQIREWAAQGIEFGLQSGIHADLTQLSAEVSESKKQLESLLGAPVVLFAYPDGEVSEAVADFARSQFDLAFTEEKGLNYLQTDPHLLRRIEVGPHASLLDIESYTHWGELDRFGRLYTRIRGWTDSKNSGAPGAD